MPTIAEVDNRVPNGLHSRSRYSHRERRLQYKISDVAAALTVHPRTVVRILQDDVDASFTKLTADKTTIPALAKAFNSTVKCWAAVLNGSDVLITQQEASRILCVPERTMRHWRSRENDPDYRFTPDVEGGQTVRFLKKRVTALKAELKSESKSG